MANSRRYYQLNNRITSIEDLYFPKTIKPSGNYTRKEVDDLRAYLLLVHAEIEAYFEDVSEEKVKDAFKNWSTNRTKSNILLSLVSFCDIEITDNAIEVRINKALTHYISKLKKNHGIKEKNILSMLLPIGLEYAELDATWLNTISSFGSDRGRIAHSSAKVQSPLDPVTLKVTVHQILSEITVIDEKLRKIK